MSRAKNAPPPAWPALNGELWPITKLIPSARNSRRHPPEQVEQIAASMREFGWTMACLVDERGELIAGHGRLLGAELNVSKYGLAHFKDAPVTIAKGWTDAQKRAYRIADNKLTINSTWDEGLLRAEFMELRTMGFALELTGFAFSEISPILGEIAPLDGMPAIPSGDKSPFEQITFTLHTSQVKRVRDAMAAANGMGGYVGSPNENRNGNAIARVAEEFLNGQRKPKKKDDGKSKRPSRRAHRAG